MGGRFALATIEAFSDKIEKAILLAPDGITEDPVYQAATRSRIARHIFKKVLKNNHKFYGFTDLMVRMGILHTSVVKFAKMMVNTSEKQTQLFNAWVGFRNLNFDIEKLIQLINNQNVKLVIFMGKYDKVLPIKNVFPLTKHLKNYELNILESSHGKLVEKTVAFYLATNAPRP
jgi:hypothetical protein